MKIARESWIILAIGLADLITTIIFIQGSSAQEANPLFRRCWEMGLAAFIGAKLAMLAGPLVILEWARRRRPRFTSFALRGAIAAYLVIYGIGCAHVNTRSYTEEYARVHVGRDWAVVPPEQIRYLAHLQNIAERRRHSVRMPMPATGQIRTTIEPSNASIRTAVTAF
jgi:hypothetical protein